MKTAVVVGGGWAGLSAGVELAEKGFQVTIFEQSGRLGGRASSFSDDKTGDVVDNGQHLIMGCYARTIEFLAKIGSLGKLKFQKNLRVDFASPGGVFSSLNCLALPAPLHIFSGLMGLGHISLSEKIACARVYSALNNWNRDFDAMTVEEWLKSLEQTENAVKFLWDPITISVLNETSDIAEARSLAKVLREGFFESRKNSCIAVPAEGLTELVAPAEKYLQERGGRVRKNELVANISFAGDSAKNIVLRNGKEITADVIVSAVPYFVLSNILGGQCKAPFFSLAGDLGSSPILSVSLWLDRPVTDRDFTAMLDTETQWLFNKSKILSSVSGDGYVTLVISGARKFLKTPDEELLNMCLEEIKSCFPESKNAKLLNHRIIREKNATLSPKVGYSKFRLSQKTPFKNFFLCGDWTDTGYPATIESAVLSGVLAAKAI